LNDPRGNVERIVPKALLERVELGAWKFVLLNRFEELGAYSNLRLSLPG